MCKIWKNMIGEKNLMENSKMQMNKRQGVMKFLERALEKIDDMSPEEVLALHLEAQEVVEDPIRVDPNS